MDIRSASEKLKLFNDFIEENQAPFEMVDLANHLGIRVYSVDWPNTDRANGRIFRDPVQGGLSGYAILVNRNHNRARRRFTIAHEIAHYILHENQIGDGVNAPGLDRSLVPEQIEVEANQLAEKILMPQNLVREKFDGGMTALDDLANKFDVSLGAMAITLSKIYK